MRRADDASSTATFRTFRDHMESALYEGRKGFYSARRPGADFYTAPELTKAYANVLARDLIARAKRLDGDPFTIVEMGSGSGLLARQLLSAISRQSPDLAGRLRYVLVERCQDILLESMTKLGSTKVRVLGYARLEDLEPCRGVFLSNELVDAFPIHVLEKTRDGVRELFVSDSGDIEPGGLSDPRLKLASEAVLEAMPEGTRHAVNLEARDWLRRAAGRLEAGWLITVDYGSRYLPGVPNPPRTFRRHRAGDDLARPGVDITANVDFEPLISEGAGLGLSLESYTTLARYLIDRGIEDFFAADPLRVKTLIHPEAMGEVFKVLVQSKGVAG